jgi:hypothetical protein
VARSLPQSEFVAHLVASLLVMAVAIVAIGQRPAWICAIGLAGIAYLLTLPYAYGKLVAQTYFEFGQVDFSPSLSDALRDELGPGGLPIHAIVLARRATEVELLVIRTGICGKTEHREAGTEHREYKAARVWTIPNAQLASIREIYPEDVIAWKVQNEKPCPPPTGMGPAVSLR